MAENQIPADSAGSGKTQTSSTHVSTPHGGRSNKRPFGAGTGFFFGKTSNSCQLASTQERQIRGRPKTLGALFGQANSSPPIDTQSMGNKASDPNEESTDSIQDNINEEDDQRQDNDGTEENISRSLISKEPAPQTVEQEFEENQQPVLSIVKNRPLLSASRPSVDLTKKGDTVSSTSDGEACYKPEAKRLRLTTTEPPSDDHNKLQDYYGHEEETEQLNAEEHACQLQNVSAHQQKVFFTSTSVFKIAQLSEEASTLKERYKEVTESTLVNPHFINDS